MQERQAQLLGSVRERRAGFGRGENELELEEREGVSGRKDDGPKNEEGHELTRKGNRQK